ncbi:hypothetical protein O181_127028 [Austropuccinia psidii MF-1]|uniref:Uncharacterized protein n=1 Tax=Austropuccinia psidii MF-1 TaxID=1389203 RepID=A0A9Q3Q6J5_9BASI|nr:hypothetical protein [Austropuccinia psidii MF-1]
MTPTRSGKFQPRGEAQIVNSRTSTSSQHLAKTFDPPLESPECDINSIPVVRPESFSTGNSENIPVSEQELVYGSKGAGVGTSSKPLDRVNQLSSSIKKVLGPKKERGPSGGLEIHVLQRTSPKVKSCIEKPKHFDRGPEERVGP